MYTVYIDQPRPRSLTLRRLFTGLLLLWVVFYPGQQIHKDFFDQTVFFNAGKFLGFVEPHIFNAGGLVFILSLIFASYIKQWSKMNLFVLLVGIMAFSMYIDNRIVLEIEPKPYTCVLSLIF